MDAVLSVQGASAPVKKKSFFSKFTRLNMLRLVRAVKMCIRDRPVLFPGVPLAGRAVVNGASEAVSALAGFHP